MCGIVWAQYSLCGRVLLLHATVSHFTSSRFPFLNGLLSSLVKLNQACQLASAYWTALLSRGRC